MNENRAILVIEKLTAVDDSMITFMDTDGGIQIVLNTSMYGLFQVSTYDYFISGEIKGIAQILVEDKTSFHIRN